MLKQYEVRFAQAEIEVIDEGLQRLSQTPLVIELRERLNTTLTCEEDMCRNKRFGMTSFCADHPQEERRVA